MRSIQASSFWQWNVGAHHDRIDDPQHAGHSRGKLDRHLLFVIALHGTAENDRIALRLDANVSQCGNVTIVQKKSHALR